LPTVPCSRSAQIMSVSQDQIRQSIEAKVSSTLPLTHSLS
jgi:hypothetical protein